MEITKLPEATEAFIYFRRAERKSIRRRAGCLINLRRQTALSALAESARFRCTFASPSLLCRRNRVTHACNAYTLIDFSRFAAAFHVFHLHLIFLVRSCVMWSDHVRHTQNISKPNARYVVRIDEAKMAKVSNKLMISCIRR